MGSITNESLFDTLQKEFCPSLDPSLIAAFLHEIQIDAHGCAIEPTSAQIRELQLTLGQLSIQADDARKSETYEYDVAFHLEETTSSWTTPSLREDNFNSSFSTNDSSGSSSSSVYSFGSPLGFLQTALPEIPVSRLQKALDGHDGNEFDLGDIIANLLDEEAIRDMEERGFDGYNDSKEFVARDSEELIWETARSKKKARIKTSTKMPQARPRLKKIALSDVRQQHHVQTPSRKGKSTNLSTLNTDPWTQVSSLSTQLSSLLPSCSASTFASFFHSPNYSNSYDAARAAILSIGNTSSEPTEEHTTDLYRLLDIVMPAYEGLDIEQRSRVISDVELAIAATGGQGDATLDLVYLLRDLDTDIILGLNHASSSPITPKSPSSPWSVSLAVADDDILPPTPIRKATKSSSSPIESTSLGDWQDIPLRPKRGPNPHAKFIPAYARAEAGRVNRAAGVDEPKLRMHKAMQKRNQALMDAAAIWQKGNMKNRGGEAALYYAERARDLQAIAKQEALNTARVMVLASRASKENHDTIDLHGTKVSEATVIVKEILTETPLSPGKSLMIITGRGNHSAGKVSVLKPAVKNALVNDGWDVSSFEGGLIVRDRHG